MPYAVLEKEIGKLDETQQNTVVSATALVHGCEVITNDAHFAHQKRVQAKTYDL